MGRKPSTSKNIYRLFKDIIHTNNNKLHIVFKKVISLLSKSITNNMIAIDDKTNAIAISNNMPPGILDRQPSLFLLSNFI